MTRVLAYAIFRQPLTQDMVEVALADMIPQRTTTDPGPVS